MPALESVEVPLSAPPANHTDSAYLESLSTRMGIPPVVADDAPPPAVVPPVPVEPGQKVADPVVQKTDRQEPQVRIENKTLKQQVADYEKRVADYEAKLAKMTELETSVTEFKTLSERTAEEKKAIEEAYRNEAAAFPVEQLDNLPEVRAAVDRFQTVASKLLPEYISDTRDDSDPDIRFDFNSLTGAQKSALGQYIDQWEDQEFDGKDSPAVRAETQRALISLMAKTIGVNPKKFVTENFRNTEMDLLPKSHPVFEHLRNNLRPFVMERRAMQAARTAAQADSKGSLGKLIQERVGNTRTLFSNVGVGLKGEALDAAIARAPENPVLQSMKLLSAHPDLLAEMEEAMEHEVTLNGHLRPQYDLAEDDPGTRTSKAQAFNIRMGKRAAYAPMAEPLMKALVRTQAQLVAEKAARAAAEAEAAKTRIQTEPGDGSLGDTTTVVATEEDTYLKRIQEMAAKPTRR